MQLTVDASLVRFVLFCLLAMYLAQLVQRTAKTGGFQDVLMQIKGLGVDIVLFFKGRRAGRTPHKNGTKSDQNN